ncbi:MAG: cytochrome ubiquinol oxidase subunit I [Bacteroidetes bacterium]|uniref:Cytochrome ubiquinol oxidase subunit I n=1 Tax=Candidatus Cryptobacteroides excrementipullorum TaxID=2840761 RepID=A0A9D9IUN8_9BACT|nr:cytochrome ubiquinol oxidase subunit I [Candidatus Cryptobacteroides excrementipullorum]
MVENALIDWSRAQFALTACYHWVFVPLTLGLSFIVAVMESIYVAKKDEFWKKAAKFWMKLFAINFAVGIATGIILEFEFGTNWSNYSWFVGDIFGAPLAIEGILAFFMEATFFAVMFFGWNKVSRKFHLASTWLTCIGASVSALWILVANAWMQHPVGMEFNPDTVRNEMVDFWAVALNPVAVSKFFHSVLSGWMTGSIFVIGVSCWYLMRKREVRFAKASIRVASVVGIVGTLAVMFSGDSSAIHVAKYQPMKLAAAEGLEDGGEKAPFSIVPGVEIPGMLSILATHDINGFVPGINDLLDGYTAPDGTKVLSADEKKERGDIALAAFKAYRENRESDPEAAAQARKVLEENVEYFGYGYIRDKQDLVPPVWLVYWPFRIMVGLGCFLLLLMVVVLWAERKDRIARLTWLQWVALCSIPLVYIAGQAGWIVAEVGRQPWAIQDLLPVNAAVSSLGTGAVRTTFFVFVAVFTLFLAIEIRILLKAIKKGPAVDEPQVSDK